MFQTCPISKHVRFRDSYPTWFINHTKMYEVSYIDLYSVIPTCQLSGNSIEQFQEWYYYVNAGDILRDENKTKESTAATIRDKGNKELAEALTTGDGPLQAGMQPNVRAANESGQRELLQSLQTDGTMSKGEVEKEKKKKEKNKDKTDKCEPKTFQESPGFTQV